MATSIARVVEISATSETGFGDAVDSGTTRARNTLRNVTAGWVKDQRVRVDGDTQTYQGQPRSHLHPRRQHRHRLTSQPWPGGQRIPISPSPRSLDSGERFFDSAWGPWQP